ncbi:MAG: hypothetical protein JOY54_07995 [Acidobacteriaceae bacterium]|nr:hypothetical protein [Acidobacteriaceae bacterium]
MNRRSFIKSAGGLALATPGIPSPSPDAADHPNKRAYRPGRIPNEYSLLLPGEDRALSEAPRVTKVAGNSVTAQLGSTTHTVHSGEGIDGWNLLTVANINGKIDGSRVILQRNELTGKRSLTVQVST